LQLLSRYIGAFGADAGLFGSILRTFISINGVEFTPETVCVFDGVQNALEQCNVWYKERLMEERTKDIIRGEQKEIRAAQVEEAIVSPSSKDLPGHMERDIRSQNEMPLRIKFFTAEPIIDRKSTFIGRACRVSDPSEVRLLRITTDSGSRHIE